jgi:hypothetical protein
MIGMSAQDPNIQHVFVLAARLPWNWSDDPPAHVFAGDKIGRDQRAVLQISYKDAFAPNEAAILGRSCIRAYAKPLLVALVLKVISSKLSALMREVTAPNLVPADFDQLARGIDWLRNLAAHAAQLDKLAFIRALVRHFARAQAMFQEGRSVSDAGLRYWPISSRPSHLAAVDPILAATGQREAANALALLGLGHDAGHWTVQADDPDNPRSGAVKVTSANGAARVIFVAHTTQAVRLFKDGVYSEDDEDVILIHSMERLPQQQRSPSREIGRPGKPSARHIEIGGLLQSASDLADLNLRFRREVAL